MGAQQAVMGRRMVLEWVCEERLGNGNASGGDGMANGAW